MKQYCFLDGKILEVGEAKIGISDIGLLRGYGIYDGITVINGSPFRFADHWNRFVSGARILNLNIPIAEEKTEKVIKELAEKNGFSSLDSRRANARMILTGGPAIRGIEYNFETPTFFILMERFEPLPKEIYENGAKLITYVYKRENPEYKTTNYITAVKLQDFKKDENATEILFVNDGEVLECATSNLFIVKNGKLITPAEDILYGITRKVVLEIAGEKYETEERRVYESELKNADEIFITSSFKDIVPVVKVDDFEVGDGKVGPVSKDIIEKFKKLIS